MMKNMRNRSSSTPSTIKKPANDTACELYLYVVFSGPDIDAIIFLILAATIQHFKV